MKYLFWRKQYKAGFCALGALQGVPKDYEIDRGISRADGFPSDATYEMRADHPKDIEVPDNVYTRIHFVVSSKLRDVLTPEIGESRVEMLPVKIQNHKKRLVSGDFFIMNPLDVIDCIDMGASGAKLNPLDQKTIVTVHKVVLRAIPAGLAVFRPSTWQHQVLVREDVGRKLEAAGLTGLVFVDSEAFKG